MTRQGQRNMLPSSSTTTAMIVASSLLLMSSSSTSTASAFVTPKIRNLSSISHMLNENSKCVSFLPNARRTNSRANKRNARFMAPENVEDEVAALRAAAAKAREDATKLAKDMGKEIDFSKETSTTATATAPPSPKTKPTASSILTTLTSTVDFTSDTASSQVSKLDTLTQSGTLTLWNAATTSSANTASPAPLRPYPVSLEFLENRSGGKLTATSLGVGGEMDVSMDDFKYATLYVVGGCSVAGVASLAFLPENIGATLCYLFALIPIAFLGIGSTAPGIIAGALASMKGTEDDREKKEERICRHEAAHFLCGYLCGLPVRRYEIAEGTNFPCVEFHPSGDGGDGRELSKEEIAALSVVAMSGSVAETLAFEVARGGENDLIELNGLFRRSKEFLGAQKQQDLTRWGALAAYQLITANMESYEKLVEAFREKKSVAECVSIIEGV